jgi:hypothetical protein
VAVLLSLEEEGDGGNWAERVGGPVHLWASCMKRNKKKSKKIGWAARFNGPNDSGLVERIEIGFFSKFDLIFRIQIKGGSNIFKQLLNMISKYDKMKTSFWGLFKFGN